MNIMLTGASGFAGAHMLKFLMERTDCFVYCPVTFNHGGHRDRIPALISRKYLNRYKLINHDLAIDSLEFNFSKLSIDSVINFASESHVDRSISQPLNFVANNINLMINLLEFLRKYPNIPLIHISTDEVYGALNESTVNKEWTQLNLPSNPYSASKSAQESLAFAYFATFKLSITIINATNMVGEAQNCEKFVPKVISRIISGEKINVDTDENGNIGSRKYLYVGDLVEAVWKVIKLKDKVYDNFKPNRFHVSGSSELSNLEMVNLISDYLAKPANIEISPSPRTGYDLRYELNSERIRALGWSERNTIDKVIENMIKWTTERPEWLFNDYPINLKNE